MIFPTFQDGMFPKYRQLFLCRAQILHIRSRFPVDLRPGMWYDVRVGSDFSGLFFVARSPLSLLGTSLTVGVGVLDDPTAKRQFSMASEKCCAFFGGTSRTPSPTIKIVHSSQKAAPMTARIAPWNMKWPPTTVGGHFSSLGSIIG